METEAADKSEHSLCFTLPTKHIAHIIIETAITPFCDQIIGILEETPRSTRTGVGLLVTNDPFRIEPVGNLVRSYETFYMIGIGRLPEFIRLEGRPGGYYPTEFLRRFIAHYLRYGYTGSLGFYRNWHNEMYSNPMSWCLLQLVPWRCHRTKCQERHDEMHPPMVIVGYNTTPGGQRDDIASIVRACEALKLPTVVPPSETL